VASDPDPGSTKIVLTTARLFDLVDLGTLTPQVAAFLEVSVRAGPGHHPIRMRRGRTRVGQVRSSKGPETAPPAQVHEKGKQT